MARFVPRATRGDSDSESGSKRGSARSRRPSPRQGSGSNGKAAGSAAEPVGAEDPEAVAESDDVEQDAERDAADQKADTVADTADTAVEAGAADTDTDTADEADDADEADQADEADVGRADAGDDSGEAAEPAARPAGSRRRNAAARGRVRAGQDRSATRRPRSKRPVREAAGRSGRKVVAPRTGSSRREKAAQAVISRLRRIALNLAVWAVLAALLAGVAVYLKVRGDAIEDASRDAVADASTAAEAIFSYDYRSFEESVANGQDFVAGKFKREYAKTTAGLKKTVLKEKAIVQAKVTSAAVTHVESGSVLELRPTRVEVLLFVNQRRRNTNITGEKLDQNRVILTMRYVPQAQGEGSWQVVDAAAI